VKQLRAAVFLFGLSIAAAAAAQQSNSTLPPPAPPPPLQNAVPKEAATKSQAPQGNTQPGVGPLGGNPLGGGPLGDLGSLDTSSSTGPVEIDAEDGIEWRQDQSVYIARGHARAVRGDTSIAADTLTAHYRNSADGKQAVYLVEADGNVVVLQKDSKIVGDRAVYDLEKGSAIITGRNLKATSKADYITARDSLEYWAKQGAVVARGDAVAADPTRVVRADLLVGYFHTDDKGKRKMYQVEATGHVRIDKDGNIALARKAIYNVESDIATLDGGVKITHGKNQLNGEHAVYNAKTGQAKVTGGKGQVKTLIVPGDKNDKGISGVFKP
jgi:lipopolysaccharide export system protein LptA